MNRQSHDTAVLPTFALAALLLAATAAMAIAPGRGVGLAGANAESGPGATMAIPVGPAAGGIDSSASTPVFIQPRSPVKRSHRRQTLVMPYFSFASRG